MMEKQARFKLDGYRIINSTISINNAEIGSELEFGFNLDGDLKDDNYTLIMNIEINDSNNVLKINVSLKGDFKIDTTADALTTKSFMYMNAPAIVFPYLRAYIATLTGLSGINTILLPTLNLTDEGLKLKEKMDSKNF